MANTKSAQKSVRSGERKRIVNKSSKTLCRSNIRKAEELIFEGKLDEAKEAVGIAVSSLDRAAEKMVIHPNNASRRKSRLLKKLNQAEAQPAGETAAKKA